MTVRIHAPASFVWHEARRCVRCKADAEHVITSYAWYGPITTCTACGAYRNDGELRRSRLSDPSEAAAARARLATSGTRADCQAWILDQIKARPA